MRSSTMYLATLVLCATLAGCGGEPAPGQAAVTNNAAGASAASTEDIGDIIATVAGFPIGSKEFEMAAQRVTPAEGDKLSDAEKRAVLDELVTEKLLYAEAKSRNIDRDPKVQKVMINTLLRQDVYASVRNADFTNEELEAYFNAHTDEFVVPAKVQVKRIFIKTTAQRPADQARALAEELRKKIAANPESFRDLAAENSDDPYRRRGGDLGFVSAEGKPGVDPMVIETAFALKDGEISPVFEAGGGFNIVQAAAHRERVERSFEQMKGSVLRKVKSDRYKQMYDDYVGKVKGTHTVTIDDAKLAGIEIKPARRLTLGGAPLGAGQLLEAADDNEEE